MTRKEYETDDAYIEDMMKRFKLVDMRWSFRDLVREAEATSMGYMEFLKRLVLIEEQGKWDRRTEKLRTEAGFESEKHLEEHRLQL